MRNNLCGTEIVSSIMETLTNARNEYSLLKAFTIFTPNRYDASGNYIKIYSLGSESLTESYDSNERKEKYVIVIGAANIGNNDYIADLNNMEQLFRLIEYLLNISEDMVFKGENNVEIDFRETVIVEKTYIQHYEDVIKEGVMELSFNVIYDHTILPEQIKEVKMDKEDGELEDVG